jgi:hypothetical protein
LIEIGKRLFGAGALALGIVGLVLGDFAASWQPVPHEFYGYVPRAYAIALALIASAAALQVRRSARLAGLVRVELFGVFALLWAVRIVRAPTVVAMWSERAEDVVLVLGSILAAGTAPNEPPGQGWRLKSVHVALGLCLLVFAAAHVVYSREIAAMVPPWTPPDSTTWGYLTDAAHGIAGLTVFACLKASLLMAGPGLHCRPERAM